MNIKEREKIAAVKEVGEVVFTAMTGVMSGMIELARVKGEINKRALVLTIIRKLAEAVGEPYGLETKKIEIAEKSADGTEMTFDLMKNQGVRK